MTQSILLREKEISTWLGIVCLSCIQRFSQMSKPGSFLARGKEIRRWLTKKQLTGKHQFVAREHATSEELSRLAVLQELQCCGLKKVNAQGHSEISGVVQSAADKFQAMLSEFGVV
jgi:hypothetical protein